MTSGPVIVLIRPEAIRLADGALLLAQAAAADAAALSVGDRVRVAVARTPALATEAED